MEKEIERLRSKLSGLSPGDKALEATPFKIKRIQTDNGKEFEKDFKKYIRGQPIIHYHTYPRRPQSNGGIERFNRTIQEQFVYWEKEDLVDDIYAFNKKLMEYLIWYNTKKPHRAINKLAPLRYYINMIIKDNIKSYMLWTRTVDCTTITKMLYFPLTIHDKVQWKINQKIRN